jgi:hypothetical protein
MYLSYCHIIPEQFIRTNDVDESVIAVGADWAARLAATPRQDRLRLARGLVRDEVKAVLGRDLADGSDHVGLMELGLDSLGLVTVARRLRHCLQQRVSDTIAFSKPSIDELAHFVLAALSCEADDDGKSASRATRWRARRCSESARTLASPRPGSRRPSRGRGTARTPPGCETPRPERGWPSWRPGPGPRRRLESAAC